jgi:hypothetical protein
MFQAIITLFVAIVCSAAIFIVVWETTVIRDERKQLQELLVQFSRLQVQFSMARAESDKVTREHAEEWAQLVQSAERLSVQAASTHASAAAELATAIRLLVGRQDERTAELTRVIISGIATVSKALVVAPSLKLASDATLVSPSLEQRQ